MNWDGLLSKLEKIEIPTVCETMALHPEVQVGILTAWSEARQMYTLKCEIERLYSLWSNLDNPTGLDVTNTYELSLKRRAHILG